MIDLGRGTAGMRWGRSEEPASQLRCLRRLRGWQCRRGLGSREGGIAEGCEVCTGSMLDGVAGRSTRAW